MTATAAPFLLHVAIDRGEGPVLVLLHGINSTGQDWATVVTSIGFDHRCIAVDELGYGQSPHPLDIEYTLDEHADSIRHTLRTIGVDQPFTLVGYSMGGPIATRYAARFPEDLSRLVLISAPFFLKPEMIAGPGLAKAVLQTDAYSRVLEIVRSDAFRESSVFSALSAGGRQVIQGFINSTDLPTDWAILQRNVLNGIERTSLPDDLAQVRVPVTFLVGEHDQFIVRSQIETLGERCCPYMDIRFLEDLRADHMLLENLPTVVAAEIVRYEDRRLAVALDRGAGEVFLLLHGVENDGSFWNAVGITLSLRNRVISLDLLGCGRSPRPLDIPYSLDCHIESIDSTLRALFRGDIPPLTLVGHSLGGIIAAEYARRNPGRVQRLVLFSVALNNDSCHPGDRHSDRAKALFVKNLGALRERGMRLARAWPVSALIGRRQLDRYEPTMRNFCNVVETEDVAGCLQATPGIPVTVVYGTRDPFVVPAYAEALAGLRPGIEVHAWQAGHDIATQRPLDTALLLDPALDPARASPLIASAPTNPKLRPPQGGFATMLRQDALPLIVRALLLLGFGFALLTAPPGDEVGLLRLAFIALLLVRSLSVIMGVFTTRSIRQEKLSSAASGVLGVVVAGFLSWDPDLARSAMLLVASGYLAVTGAIALYAVGRIPADHGQRGRLLVEGWVSLALGLLLAVGSVLAERLAIALIMAGSIAAGVLLLTYVLVTLRIGRAYLEA